MKPSEIYYSQDSIRDKFDKKYTIQATYNVLVRQPGVMQRIPRIRVCLKDGKWFTLNNRRLWVFRKLEENGYIRDINVIHVGRDKLQDSKFTTTNGGKDVIVRPTKTFSINDFFDSDSN